MVKGMTHPEILFAEKNGCGFWQLENPPVHFCDYCGCNISEEDEFYELHAPVCTDCVDATRKIARAA